MENTPNRMVYRCQYRGLLTDCSELERAVFTDACAELARSLVRGGHLMTAALYYYGNQLFLYYEAVGKLLEPSAFMAPLEPLLALWPQNGVLRPWAQMMPIYWHDLPHDEADWQRPTLPTLRRGRIAQLSRDAIFSYCYHHFAIVREGLLDGDRYQFISLHEDILFSYFEEPKTMAHIRREDPQPSTAIDAWVQADPEAHFIPLPGANGNFLFLPACFALGR